MHTDPTPPSPLPSQTILDEAKAHYQQLREIGVSSQEYAIAALRYLLPLIDEERPKHDSKQSLNWSLHFETKTFWKFLELWQSHPKETGDFKAFKKEMETALKAVKSFSKKQGWSGFGPLQSALDFSEASEMTLFVQKNIPRDSDSKRWWTSSIWHSLNQLARFAAFPSTHEASRSDDDHPYFFVHKIFTIMAIFREEEVDGGMEEGLDWHNVEALEEARLAQQQFFASFERPEAT